MSEQNLLRDIELELHHRSLRPVYRAKTQFKRGLGNTGWTVDLSTVSGEDNLEQAIIIRLLTPIGELSALGHPEYGSRLFELVGRTNTETTRNLIRLRVIESVSREPRVEEIIMISVKPTPRNTVRGWRSSIDIYLEVKPMGSIAAISIGPLALDLTS